MFFLWKGLRPYIKIHISSRTHSYRKIKLQSKSWRCWSLLPTHPSVTRRVYRSMLLLGQIFLAQKIVEAVARKSLIPIKTTACKRRTLTKATRNVNKGHSKDHESRSNLGGSTESLNRLIPKDLSETHFHTPSSNEKFSNKIGIMWGKHYSTSGQRRSHTVPNRTRRLLKRKFETNSPCLYTLCLNLTYSCLYTPCPNLRSNSSPSRPMHQLLWLPSQVGPPLKIVVLDSFGCRQRAPPDARRHQHRAHVKRHTHHPCGCVLWSPLDSFQAHEIDRQVISTVDYQSQVSC